MAARLMAAASRPLAYGVSPHVDTDAMCNLVDERGIGWLLVPEQRPDQVPDGVSAGSAAGAGDSTLGRQNKADSLTAGPLERLTARYAEGEAARDWQRFGRTITRRAAVDAALADPGLPDSELLAVLALWKELQAEIDEIAKVTAGRLAGAVGRKAFTYEQIGDVLGVKRQSAHTWVAGRIQGAPLRRRNPPA
jgi:hypothetical protein